MTGRQATSVNFVYKGKPQLLQTFSPDISKGGGMETERHVFCGGCLKTWYNSGNDLLLTFLEVRVICMRY